MYLIADSGSTKTQWCLIEGEKRREIRTSGINPVYQSEIEIGEMLKREFGAEERGIEAIYFYGAGCAFPEKNEQVKKALDDFFKSARIEIASDLLAAARALFQRQKGIACILGTGSNSCYYDGENIVRNIPPLGFILGDEGSGAVMGKRLVADILKGILSKELADLFFQTYPYSYAELIERIYRQPFPNRFLAAFTLFLKQHIASPEINKLVSDSLEEFIIRNLVQYKEVDNLPVSFIGSIAFHFQEQLFPLLDKYGFRAGKIVPTPMDGLIAFHTGVLLP
ncbi:BadF/BadG/BcrA/BcrD ATPase family protein [Odoribacter lunatus]|uniref:BadF/BadG/BcrA/BcrD ATPase family protein n=1 Tax=Odoribacter lunatus TaxID=2941335 RepID=UPI00203CE904|nr:BadF/BadG/BcrA/BcrD ATPase family protein [Odoribacter lunatus]